MKLLCRIFGHRMHFDTTNVCGTSTCKRTGCNHKLKGINWPPIDNKEKKR